MYSDILNSGLSVLNRAGDVLRRGGGADSLVDFTSVGRVEPLVLMEQAAMHLDCIGEVQQSILAIFAGYYLQAASLSNAMGNIRVVDRLDSLNPNRTPITGAMNGFMIATESMDDVSPWLVDKRSYAQGLPFPTNQKLKLSIESNGMGSLGGAPNKTNTNNHFGAGAGGQGSGGRGHNGNGNTAGAFGGMGTSSAKAAPGMGFGQGKQGTGGHAHSGAGGTSGAMGGMGVGGKGEPDDYDESGKPTKAGTGQHGSNVQALSKHDIGRTMTELANLSVGKSYEINITDGDKSIPVLVNIRLIASTISTADLVHILATGSEDNSFKERWHGWRSGRLAFWKDLVFTSDLIDKHRADLLKDKTGTLGSIGRTNTGNLVSSLVSGSPTIASSTNIAVLTKDGAERLELNLEGRLSKFDIRQRMMKKTSLMILVVVDEADYNTVTFYTRGIPMPTTVRIKDLKASNSKGGPDIGEILKSLMSGHAPSI